jgi:hypothetical protein
MYRWMEKQRDRENYTYGQTEKHKNVQKDGQIDEQMYRRMDRQRGLGKCTKGWTEETHRQR